MKLQRREEKKAELFSQFVMNSISLVIRLMEAAGWLFLRQRFSSTDYRSCRGRRGKGRRNEPKSELCRGLPGIRFSEGHRSIRRASISEQATL